ncbi:hypothetical protein [Desertivirga xinjiangensis]|uniref:hypothetical protein n=1 Tax=Desertivirga xinjiangensis TaxID=539206 RepID=UPI00210A9555|nr:hypothetical protein [Pedobacter xinjiangensis]
MTHSISKISATDDELKALELETELLEKELSMLEYEINAFESEIRSALYVQIKRIKELTEKYKGLKLDKKNRRLEQKKRGKNYREPVGLKPTRPALRDSKGSNASDQRELKRLYKEAIVQVHPDKLTNADEDTTQRATALTVELNKLYKKGDLEELNSLHEHILSGNAMQHERFRAETLASPAALLSFLKKKKANLIGEIENLKMSALYQELALQKSHADFINDLRMQFEQRIIQLEFRTRKAKD